MSKLIVRLLVGASLLAATPVIAGTRCALTTDKGDSVEYFFNKSNRELWLEAAYTKNNVRYPSLNPVWQTRWQGRYFILTPVATR